MLTMRRLREKLQTSEADYIHKYVSEKVLQWSQELTLLSAIATTQPHAAFAAYSHGLYSKWSYLTRTVPEIGQQLKQLDVIVRQQFVPNLTSRPPPSDLETNLLSLPAKLGGIGVTLPSTNSSDNFKASLEVTAPLRLLIESGINSYSYETLADQTTTKTEVRRKRREEANLEADNLKNDLPAPIQRAMDLAREKGSSSWLTALPLKEHSFTLHMQGSFCRCPCIEVWLDTLQYPNQLSLRSQLHGGACAVLPAGWIPLYQT